MRYFGGIHLKRKPGNTAECFGMAENFFCYFFGTAYQQCTFRSDLSLEPASGHRRPSSFLAHLGHSLRIARVKIIQCLLGRGCHIPQRVHPYFQLFGEGPCLFSRLAVEFYQRAKAMSCAADNGNHQGQSSRSGPNEGFGGTANAQPNWYGWLEGPWIDGLVLKLGTEFTLPGNKLVIANLK